MSDTPEFLSKKVGPLPAGAWLAVAAGGLAAAYFLRNNGAQAAAAPTVDGATQWADNTMPTAGNLSVGYADSNPTSSAPDPGTGYAAPTTNEEWAQLAERALLGKGYLPLLVDGAIRNYLAGMTLSASEQAVVTEALIVAGPPPIQPPPPLPGVTPPHITPTVPAKPQPPATKPAHPSAPAKPTPKPAAHKPAPKPAAKHYTVKRGDNLWTIGLRNHRTAGTLYKANAGVIEAAAHKYGHKSSGNGSLIFPGTVLVIP